MDNPSTDKQPRARASEKPRGTRDSTSLSPETFRGDELTPAKKLPSPARSNEDSTSSALSRIPALVVDLEISTTTGRDGDDSEISDSGSSTPKASQQHRDSLRESSPQFDDDEATKGGHQHHHHRRGNPSISSSTTRKLEEYQDQKVLDDMVDKLARGQEQDQDNLGYEDDVLSERSQQLSPARSLRRERRMARDDEDSYKK